MVQEEAPKQTGGLFGFGGRQSAPEPQPEPEPKPARRGFFGSGGGKSEMSELDQPEEQPKRGLFGGGRSSGTKVVSPVRGAYWGSTFKMTAGLLLHGLALHPAQTCLICLALIADKCCACLTGPNSAPWGQSKTLQKRFLDACCFFMSLAWAFKPHLL